MKQRLENISSPRKRKWMIVYLVEWTTFVSIFIPIVATLFMTALIIEQTISDSLPWTVLFLIMVYIGLIAVGHLIQGVLRLIFHFRNAARELWKRHTPPYRLRGVPRCRSTLYLTEFKNENTIEKSESFLIKFSFVFLLGVTSAILISEFRPDFLKVIFNHPIVVFSIKILSLFLQIIEIAFNVFQIPNPASDEYDRTVLLLAVGFPSIVSIFLIKKYFYSNFRYGLKYLQRYVELLS